MPNTPTTTQDHIVNITVCLLKIIGNGWQTIAGYTSNDSIMRGILQDKVAVIQTIPLAQKASLNEFREVYHGANIERMIPAELAIRVNKPLMLGAILDKCPEQDFYPLLELSIHLKRWDCAQELIDRLRADVIDALSYNRYKELLRNLYQTKQYTLASNLMKKVPKEVQEANFEIDLENNNNHALWIYQDSYQQFKVDYEEMLYKSAFRAVQRGDFGHVITLVEKKYIDPNKVYKTSGETIFHALVRENAATTITRLSRKLPKKKEVVNAEGDTPSGLAIRLQHKEALNAIAKRYNQEYGGTNRMFSVTPEQLPHKKKHNRPRQVGSF